MSYRGMLILPVLALAPACHDHHDDDDVEVLVPRVVSIEVEVFDPITDGVWENVGVRVVEASVEFAGCICVNRFEDDFFLTDANGFVYFGPAYLADTEVGFPVDLHGDALLSPREEADEAIVVLEVWAEGFEPVFAEIDLTWEEPEVFVSIPFEAPGV